MKIFETPGLILISVLLVLAIGFFTYPFLIKSPGAYVTEITDDSACGDVVSIGSVITEINGERIQNTGDFSSITKGLTGRIQLRVNEGPRVCNIEENQTIGLKVIDKEKESVELGVNIGGGKKFILSSESPEKDSDIMQKRFISHGMENVKLEENGNLELIFDPKDETLVRKFLEPGKVNAKLFKYIELENRTGDFSLNEKNYEIEFVDNEIEIEGDRYQTGDKFSIDGIDIEVSNITENITSLYLDVFNGMEIQVLEDTQSKRVVKNQGRYVFVLGVSLSDKAGENFAKVTKDQPTRINPQGENFLEDPLLVMVDGEVFTSFPISSAYSGQEITQLNVWGVENNQEEAREKLKTLSTFIESGELSEIEILEVTETEPGNRWLLNTGIYIAVGLFVGLGIYGFIRGKNIKSVAVISGIFLTELMILVGALSSPTLVVVLLISSITLTAFKGEFNNWIKWSAFGILFTISFGGAVNKIVLDTYSLTGSIFGLTLSSLYLIFLNEFTKKSRKKYEKFVKLSWKVSLGLSLGLLIVFLLQDYKNFAIVSAIITITGLIITKAGYSEIMNKLD